jgi:resuscitation-promoting factor RpfB
LPSDASPAVQDEAAEELQSRSGWGQWPECAAELGLY